MHWASLHARSALEYADDKRSQAHKMFVDGLKFHQIARLLSVHHQTIINSVNAVVERIPAAPPVPWEVETVERDELYPFVKTKKTKSTS